MGGKACIRGLRVTVGMIVGQIGAGRSVDEVLADYPYLEREDVMQALLYAACAPKSARSICLRRNETAYRYEPVAALGEYPGGVRR